MKTAECLCEKSDFLLNAPLARRKGVCGNCSWLDKPITAALTVPSGYGVAKKQKGTSPGIGQADVMTAALTAPRGKRYDHEIDFESHVGCTMPGGFGHAS
jgi:hypothetical protein